MKRFKEHALFIAAILLYQASSLLFDAAQKESKKSCPSNLKRRRDHEHQVN
jgi:hypothetical protein